MRVGWHDEYLRIAPRPEDFPRLFAKKTAMDAAFTDLCDDDVRTVERRSSTRRCPRATESLT